MNIGNYPSLQSLEVWEGRTRVGASFLLSEDSVGILGVRNHGSQTLDFLDQRNLLPTPPYCSLPSLGQREA